MTFPTKMTVSTFAVVIAAALAGCASAPPQNPRLSRLESDLAIARGDKYVAEYGQADLLKADASLADARVALHKGHDNELQHDLTMGEGYLAQGGIHGRQERVKAETVALKDRQDQVRLASRDRAIGRANDRADASQADAALANAAMNNANDRADSSRLDTALASAATQNANDRADASHANALAAQAATQSAEQKMAAMRTQLNVYDMRFSDAGATLVLHDVMFDVNSSILRDGAVSRLEPLATYLRANPAISVRIDGHTDSSGNAARNNDLSLDRANAVKRALTSSITVANAIETHGYGQTRPVASNGTSSGREQNRRVEITLQ